MLDVLHQMLKYTLIKKCSSWRQTIPTQTYSRSTCIPICVLSTPNTPSYLNDRMGLVLIIPKTTYMTVGEYQ